MERHCLGNCPLALPQKRDSLKALIKTRENASGHRQIDQHVFRSPQKLASKVYRQSDPKYYAKRWSQTQFSQAQQE